MHQDDSRETSLHLVVRTSLRLGQFDLSCIDRVYRLSRTCTQGVGSLQKVVQESITRSNFDLVTRGMDTSLRKLSTRAVEH